MFNADLALSVTMTAISTVLSVIALPVNLLIYANISYAADVTSDLDWQSVFIALAIVISAISLGLYCSYRCHSYKFNILANKVCSVSLSRVCTFEIETYASVVFVPTRSAMRPVSF
jgi:predicted Na+-dependent transporter